MEKLLAKHWKGWLIGSSMRQTAWIWIEHWSKEADRAEDEGNELVIIEVPKHSGALEAIERMLQEKFPLNSK